MSKLHLFFLMFLLIGIPIIAQDDLIAPPEIPGEVVYIPFPVEITLDGDLSDWAGVPTVTVDRGTMLSPDPAENGSFTFAVASDATNLYIFVTMPDQNIITGQHGTNFWNEDSLEFYLNLSGDFFRTTYTDGIFQININPGDIGNTDPADITITGTQGTASGVQALVFATEGGWGFEAAVPIADRITVAHGAEIGFQVHANGATTADRDVKLIWSLADSGDNSWQNPSVFGRGLFFEIGREDIPTPGMVEEPEGSVRKFVAVNQTGYFPNGAKLGVLATDTALDSLPQWSLLNARSGAVVLSGPAKGGAQDSASGDFVYTADFSQFKTPGSYILEIDGVQSVPFAIRDDLYAQLKIDALHYFYLSRSGIELVPEYAGEAWARRAGHLSDNDVTCYAGTDADGRTWEGCDYRLDASKGWYDAGDYGKYVVNSAISVWTLMNLYEKLPDAFPDASMSIPENTNSVPDILDEVRWNLEFMLGMQVPEGEDLAGMVHHKLHNLQWDGMPVLPRTEDNNDSPTNGRYLMPPSTAATLGLAASAAQCARVWAEFDTAFADRCLMAAETAWTAALAHPDMFYGNTPGAGGGNYDDRNVEDEFYWAAVELFITTGKDEYRDFLTESRYFTSFPGLMPGEVSSFGWQMTGALGTISLTTVPNSLPEADLQGQIIRTADNYLRTIRLQGYAVPVPANGFYWGSNSFVLNNAIILGLAYDFTKDDKYLEGAVASMDYILGRNPVNLSYVSGYGTMTMQHPHHRFWFNSPASGFPPPPPGVVAGGPNQFPDDPTAVNAGLVDLPPARRYMDDSGSWTTNEVAINWNAPLTWVAAYLDARLNSLRTSCCGW